MVAPDALFQVWAEHRPGLKQETVTWRVRVNVRVELDIQKLQTESECSLKTIPDLYDVPELCYLGTGDIKVCGDHTY